MTTERTPENAWMTKPTDRFILKWIKINLSSHITSRIVDIRWLQPWMITVMSALIGLAAGATFAMGRPFIGALVAAVSQVLDGVDGQLSRRTGKASAAGAFLDSCLDRYSDGALVLGLLINQLRSSPDDVTGFILTVGAFALIGSGLISYSSARADSLGIDVGKPTLASKGTRTTVVVVAGLLSPVIPLMPFLALCYLAIHTNVVVFLRILRVFRGENRVP
jgi:phosphatidylglycerophosphate synthase